MAMAVEASMFVNDLLRRQNRGGKSHRKQAIPGLKG